MAPTPDPKRRALGKGLESLLPQRKEVLPTINASDQSGHAMEIPVDQIERNPFQTRTRFDEAQLQDLANSIAATGVVQPITVRAIAGSNRFQLITGERRLLASRKAGKSHIPCILRTVSDEQSLEMTIVENLQRADLNPMEQAHAYQRLATTFKMTQEQMATRTGKDRASVANFLRLLRLPEVVQNQVEAGTLTFGHARTLLALPESIEAAAQKVQQNHLSVRQTETYIHSLLNPEPKQNKQDKPNPPQDPNVHEAQQTLQRSLGLKVKIEDKKGKGKVIIEYSGIEDFDAILTALGQAK